MNPKNKLYMVILIFSSVVFVIAAVQLAFTLRQYKNADMFYAEIRNQYVKSKEPVPSEPEPDSTDEQTAAPEPETLPITVDFNALLQENKDIVGWLYCEGTPINYPVVQAEDNGFYLRRDLQENYLVSGTLFVDCRNTLPGKDLNYIIFGHNMKNASMFGSLTQSKEQSYYDAHPTLYYFTPQGAYKIEAYAGLVVSTKEIIYTADPVKEDFKAYLKVAKERSTFVSDVEIGENDSTLTLSTCSYEFEGARYVLIGKLVQM